MTINSEKQKPTVFIASPYTKGDQAMNTHFQCLVFDKLLSDNIVLPIAPLWSHYQHTLFPRPYEDWIKYDQAMLRLYDCCLRLEANIPSVGYKMNESSGADAEVETFRKMNKPVFFSIEEVYTWANKM